MKIEIKLISIIWRGLVCLYAPLLYTLDIIESIIIGEIWNQEKTKTTFLMYFYRY